MKLIVTESDNGDSLSLPGEWSVDDVDYDENGNSITTYEINSDDVQSMKQALESADGVASYKFYKSETSIAAAKMRAIPSKKRSEQSRINGRRSPGRPAKTQPTPREPDKN
jgi:hypothetical protein